MSTALVNPYAPNVYNGINDQSPRGYADIDFTYVYDVVLNPSAVAAGQYILQDQKGLDNDADFVWRGTVLNTYTGSFAVRFSDSNWYWLANSRILNTNLLGNASAPSVVWPEIILPAGGRIGIDIQDLSGAANTIEIAFRGVKRFRVGQ
ncbi:MAG: hypothetical protein U0Q18_25320 [Bryobacteraceae bacterium]